MRNQLFMRIFITILLLNLWPNLLKAENSNTKFTQIPNEETFRTLIVGNILVGPCTVVINSNQTVEGECKKGAISGTWEWVRGKFCRVVSVGDKQLPYECQKFEYNVQHKKARVVSSVRKKKTIYQVKRIKITNKKPLIDNTKKPKFVISGKSASLKIKVDNQPTRSKTSVSVRSEKWRGAKTVDEAIGFARELDSHLSMFLTIAKTLRDQPQNSNTRANLIVSEEIKRLRAEKKLLATFLSGKFETPVWPKNKNLSVSAFRAADTFPKIPFYVPGTDEIGEMLIIPRVTDAGFLTYKFDFLDPTSSSDKVRDTIIVAHEHVETVIQGLQKIDQWTSIAQQKKINRRIEKSAACVPVGNCENKKQGVSSTEIVFQIYEDGSTAGRIQSNKGRFSVGYNLSVESSLLLSAYLTYMRIAGAREFNMGIMSDEDVKKLFK